jgi:hypothetical protein
MLSLTRTANAIARLGLGTLNRSVSTGTTPTVIRTSMPTSRSSRPSMNSSIIPTTSQKRRTSNFDIKQMVEGINKSYQRTNVRVRQIAARILKQDRRSRLFLMLRNLVRIPNFNTTHLVLIFGRLVEIEKYERQKKKTGAKTNRIPLAEHPFFYKCLHSIESNIGRMQGMDLAFLVKTINKASFMKINFFPIVTAIDENLSADNLLEMVDKITLCHLFTHFVAFRKVCDEEEEACLKEFTGKLVRASFRHVREESLPIPIYFKMAKYSYFLRLKSYSRINNLHKILLRLRKQADSRSYYYWFLLTTLENSDKGNKTIVINDIINKKIFRKLKLRQNVKLLKKVLHFELEDNQVLKKIFIKEAVEAIKVYLQIIVSRSIVDKNLYKLTMFLMRADKNYKEFNEELKQICDKGLFINSEDHQLMIYFFRNKIEPGFEHIKRICENGKFTHLSMSTILNLHDEINAKKYEFDRTGLHKKLVKVFVRSAPFLRVSCMQDTARMKEIMVRNPAIFGKYFEYLMKKLKKIQFIKLSNKKPKEGIQEDKQSTDAIPQESADDFDLAEDNDAEFDDENEIPFENSEIPEEYFLRKVKMTNIFLLFHLNFINEFMANVNLTKTKISIDEIQKMVKIIQARTFARHLNEQQILFLKEIAEKPASELLKATLLELVADVIRAQEGNIGN